jgi:hypothetical protein
MAPGPELAAALARIDVTVLASGDLPVVLAARSRQRSHEEAEFLGVIAEMGWRDPFAGLSSVAHTEVPSRYAADELRVGLAWTRQAAAATHSYAAELVTELPQVFEALRAGEIDPAKARVFHRHLLGLPPAHIQTICQALLPKAGRLTTGQLAARLARMVIAIDPDRAREQYEHAVAERGVVAYLNPDATATLTGHALPPDQVATASQRIHQLALQAKRAGHPGRLDQIKADLYLGLLNGRFNQMSRAQIITELLDQPEGDSPATGIEISVELATLLGHNDHPGTTPGLGAILAHIARRIVARQRRAQWRFTLTDQRGHFAYGGITRQRPTGTARTAEGGIVELLIPIELLHELAKDPRSTGNWARVIADIAEQYAEGEPHTQELDRNLGRRLPRQQLRRHIHQRDRVCKGPGCRRAATTADFDHTRDHQYGGPTTAANGGPLCKHDHNLKTKGGWELDQPQPGVFVWYTPLGQIYRSRGDPVLPPPF